jgi:hypothetical protein
MSLRINNVKVREENLIKVFFPGHPPPATGQRSARRAAVFRASPLGRSPMCYRTPAINRRATVICPSGTVFSQISTPPCRGDMISDLSPKFHESR